MQYILGLYKGRINRINYLVGIIIAIIVLIVIQEFIRKIENIPLLSGIILIVFIVYIYSLVVRRLHDTGRSGWWALLGFIPFANCLLGLWLFFKGGEEKKNKYDIPPAKQS